MGWSQRQGVVYSLALFGFVPEAHILEYPTLAQVVVGIARVHSDGFVDPVQCFGVSGELVVAHTQIEVAQLGLALVLQGYSQQLHSLFEVALLEVDYSDVSVQPPVGIVAADGLGKLFDSLGVQA